MQLASGGRPKARAQVRTRCMSSSQALRRHHAPTNFHWANETGCDPEDLQVEDTRPLQVKSAASGQPQLEHDPITDTRQTVHVRRCGILRVTPKS